MRLKSQFHKFLATASYTLVLTLRSTISLLIRPEKQAFAPQERESSLREGAILFLIPQMRHGGAERAVSRLIPLLNDQYRIRLLTFQDSPESYYAPCPVDSMGISPVRQGSAFRRIVNTIERVRYLNNYKRINHVRITYSFGDSANLVSVLSEGGLRVTSVRGHARIDRRPTSILGLFLTAVFCASDAVVCVSQLIATSLQRRFSISPEKLWVIYNGYNLQELPRKTTVDSSPDKASLVSMGTFRLAKGYWHLIKAVHLVRKSIPYIQLTLMGSDYRDHRKEIEQLIERLGLQEHVTLLPFQQNPFSELIRHDVYVLSSISEGFPNALVEALGCGIPVVAADCKSGPREILSPNTDIFIQANDVEIAEYGILVPPFESHFEPNSLSVDPEDRILASAIETIINSKPMRDRYSEIGERRVRDFSTATWQGQHVALFNYLTGQSDSRSS